VLLLACGGSDGATGQTGGSGSGGSNPVNEPADPGSGYLWSEDYDRYTSVASMFSTGNCAAGTDAAGMPAASVAYGNRRTEPNFTDGCHLQTNADGLQVYQLITGRTGTGKAIRSNIAGAPAGVNQGANWNGPWNAADINNSVTKTVVLQHWFRASVGGGPGPVGMKWIEVFVNDAGSQVRSSGGQKVIRLQWSTNGGGGSQWRVNDGPNTSGFDRTLQPIGPYLDHGTGKLNDGNWHRATYLFKANTTSTYFHTGGTNTANETYTGTSSRDGRLAMWVDDVKVLDYSQATVGVTPTGGTGPWCYQSDVDWIPTGTFFQRIQYPGTNNDTRASWVWDSDDMKVWQF
jgi:hypothetical protein